MDGNLERCPRYSEKHRSATKSGGGNLNHKKREKRRRKSFTDIKQNFLSFFFVLKKAVVCLFVLYTRKTLIRRPPQFFPFTESVDRQYTRLRSEPSTSYVSNAFLEEFPILFRLTTHFNATFEHQALHCFVCDVIRVDEGLGEVYF